MTATRIIAFLRPHRLEHVKSAIAAIGISGLNVLDVRGQGSRHASNRPIGVAPMPICSRLEVVVADELVQEVVAAIIDQSRTGEPGDGKIFLEKIESVARIRTGETGEAAL